MSDHRARTAACSEWSVQAAAGGCCLRPIHAAVPPQLPIPVEDRPPTTRRHRPACARGVIHILRERGCVERGVVRRCERDRFRCLPPSRSLNQLSSFTKNLVGCKPSNGCCILCSLVSQSPGCLPRTEWCCRGSKELCDRSLWHANDIHPDVTTVKMLHPIQHRDLAHNPFQPQWQQCSCGHGCHSFQCNVTIQGPG